MIDISHNRDTDITLIPDDVLRSESISDPNLCPSFDSQGIPEANTQLPLDPDDSTQITAEQSTSALEGEVKNNVKPDKKKWNEFDCEFSEINKDA